MIPATFVEVTSFPLLSNGKLDLKSLPEPFKDQKREIGQRIYTNEQEKKLATIWKSLLQSDGFDLEDNFYEVGGHSLLMLKMKYFIDMEFKTDIDVVTLFQYPTIKQLAEVIVKKEVLKKRKNIAQRALLRKQAFKMNSGIDKFNRP